MIPICSWNGTPICHCALFLSSLWIRSEGEPGFDACTTTGTPAVSIIDQKASSSALPSVWPEGVGIGDSITVVAPAARTRSASARANSRSASGITPAQRSRMGSSAQNSQIQSLYARAYALRKSTSGMSSSPKVMVGNSTLTAMPCSSINSIRRTGSSTPRSTSVSRSISRRPPSASPPGVHRVPTVHSMVVGCP